jgi:hypothetical protein
VPNHTAAVTVANTPDACIRWAGTNARNGVVSDHTAWLSGSRVRSRSRDTAMPTISPNKIPPATCTTIRTSTSGTDGLAPRLATAIANRVNATASLISPSASSTVTRRPGTPSRCSTVVAATGSGGAIAAANASAAAQPMSGKISSSVQAAANAVASTRPTDWPTTAPMCSIVSLGSLKNAA